MWEIFRETDQLPLQLPARATVCVIMDTLIDQFELEETGRFRAVPSADDVVAILSITGSYSPEERQRAQLAIMGIFYASTTARAGTIIKSSCYFGRNEAVEYGVQALLKDGRRTEALVRVHGRVALLTVGGSS
jgi:hypothetical protein